MRPKVRTGLTIAVQALTTFVHAFALETVPAFLAYAVASTFLDASDVLSRYVRAANVAAVTATIS